MNYSSSVTSIQLPLTSMNFSRIHSCRLYFIYLTLCLPVCLSINLECSQPAYLSILCQCLHLNISISLFSVSCLRSTQLTIYNGTAFLICHSKSSFMFCDSCMHTHTDIFHTLCPLPSIKESCYRIWPCASSVITQLSLSCHCHQLDPLSCI